MPSAIRVLIIDAQLTFRAALASWLQQQPGLDVVADFADATLAVEHCAVQPPDVIVMDPMSSGLCPLAAARVITTRWPELRIIFLSSRNSERLACDCLAAGGECFLSKDAHPSGFLEALHSRPTQSDATTNGTLAPRRLTARELEVLRYVARGLSHREMSEVMFLSPKTVERHVSRVMKKVSIHDRVGLARYAIREGIEPI